MTVPLVEIRREIDCTFGGNKKGDRLPLVEIGREIDCTFSGNKKGDRQYL